MLVLTLKENESIVIPVIGLKIKLIKTSGNRARIGFEAPSIVKILREKLVPTGIENATPIDEHGNRSASCDNLRRGEVWKNKVDSNVR